MLDSAAIKPCGSWVIRVFARKVFKINELLLKLLREGILGFAAFYFKRTAKQILYTCNEGKLWSDFAILSFALFSLLTLGEEYPHFGYAISFSNIQRTASFSIIIVQPPFLSSLMLSRFRRVNRTAVVALSI